MKLGIISMWGEDFGQFRDQIRLAEELELSLIGLGDSPVGWHELYVSLTVAAMETKHATVAPMVTTPIGRHPAVAAGAMSSLYDLTGGRVAFAIGTGGSMVKGLGRGLATQAEIAPYLKAMRALFAGESIEWDGSRVTPLAFARPVPIYYSATGPKALALAGELADGVVLTVGSSMSELDEKIAQVRAGAEKAGRDPQSIDIWAYSFCSVRDSRTEALADISSFLASTAAHQLKNKYFFDRVPENLKPKVLEVQRRYDVTQHTVAGGVNGKLVEALGLADYLAGLNSIAGTPEEVAGQLSAIRERGISRLMIALPGISDREGTVRRMTEAMKLSERTRTENS
jgi:alkanesulfonate monooxygenase SsuD/methylene tetrahydromethanopterin reductase-like flavin-dependent oxidoreductase (luciferase family)